MYGVSLQYTCTAVRRGIGGGLHGEGSRVYGDKGARVQGACGGGVARGTWWSSGQQGLTSYRLRAAKPRRPGTECYELVQSRETGIGAQVRQGCGVCRPHVMHPRGVHWHAHPHAQVDAGQPLPAASPQLVDSSIPAARLVSAACGVRDAAQKAPR